MVGKKKKKKKRGLRIPGLRNRKKKEKKKRRLSIEGHHQISQHLHKHSIRGKDRDKME